LEQVVNIDQQMVRPISPVAGYIGGKRTLAKVLVPKIAAIPHELYAEPFMGLIAARSSFKLRSEQGARGLSGRGDGAGPPFL
jgi:hypothetical protein